MSLVHRGSHLVFTKYFCLLLMYHEPCAEAESFGIHEIVLFAFLYHKPHAYTFIKHIKNNQLIILHLFFKLYY